MISYGYVSFQEGSIFTYIYPTTPGFWWWDDLSGKHKGFLFFWGGVGWFGGVCGFEIFLMEKQIAKRSGWLGRFFSKKNRTLLETDISPTKALLSRWFSFSPHWDMSVPWRVIYQLCQQSRFLECWRKYKDLNRNLKPPNVWVSILCSELARWKTAKSRQSSTNSLQPTKGHGKVYPTGSTLEVDKSSCGVEFKPIFVEGWLNPLPTKKKCLVSQEIAWGLQLAAKKGSQKSSWNFWGKLFVMLRVV